MNSCVKLEDAVGTVLELSHRFAEWEEDEKTREELKNAISVVEDFFVNNVFDGVDSE